ncbi:RNA polymerase subunit sigma-70 [Intrasporangium oryzae NRRL B-24470]|uniref:RNA polymerase subunit sigma-70 n=1 Tax=Intrasporangium oryzae NRRL B-24470 TaxID=1386089 RepID=W9GBP2_9MICO|nr:SigE family RNA polymerase sigma factor [Intrasporangium oryzae]EWT02642.1 RNA polymerase subunit sigma-70 [Intrasporangium oryzae NRRL B-24470]
MGNPEREADFTAYVQARQRHLARFAYLLTGDTHSAEDLVQSALAKVYRKWDSIHDSPDAYVRQVIVNEHRSWWRRTWRHQEVTGSDLITYADPPAPADEHPDNDLRTLVRSLPRQQRAAIVLRYYEDLTEAQTAAVLGCSVGTVKSHTSRALKALRTTMKEVMP